MNVTAIDITEKVKNYEGANKFIHDLKPGLQKWGKLTPKQYSIAEKLILQEIRNKELSVGELPEHLRIIAEYNGESKFVLDIKSKFEKYHSLTPKQVEAAHKTIKREKEKNSQKHVNVNLVGNTIKVGRKISTSIKREYNLDFHPILIDVTGVTVISDKALKLKGKLTKENGGICRCCGKTLTDEMSQVTGIGPICAKYVGVEHPKTKDEVQKFKDNMSKRIDEIGEFEFWIPKSQVKEWDGSGVVLLRM
jgi:hypothetical protein